MLPVVRLLEQRIFDPPRSVEVDHNGAWWAGTQTAWRLCDDGRGWRADVEYVVEHERGRGRHVPTVPPERLRPVAP